MNTFIKRSWWSTADKIVAVLVVLFMILYFFGNSFGKIEGKFFPVVKDFNFSIERLNDQGMVVVKGSFDIIRDNCSFMGLSWKISNGQRNVDVPIVFENGSRLRPKGFNKYSGWVLDIPPELLDKSIVVVKHQCPYTPWVTTTHLYPTEEK